MHRQALLVRAFAFAAGVAILAFSGWVGADPPSRVARLGYAAGAVSFSPAGESDWVQATINRPLTSGDRLWTDAGARAEIQIGGATIRMHAGSGISILNLDERIAQLQLTQGTLNVRVRRLRPDQTFEVDTPNLAFALRQPGEYRIEVDPDGNATTIIVRKGQGEVYGEGASYLIDARQPYRFTGTDLREYEYVDAPRADEFDRWSSARDRRYDSSGSARYVSEDVVGYQDLDANGTWRVDATYGNIWTPNRVDAGWAPYRDGHWAWIDPWGWTWVDDAPWGYAVSHYGRWTNLRGTWGWVPGPVRTQAYYAPALVVFVGGANFQFMLSGGNVGGVAWFPLGPREVYRPAYPVSRGYFENINRSNTVISNTIINNYYNNSNVTNVVYANRQVPGAVVAVPTSAFVQSQPVSRVAQRVTREAIAAAPVAFVAPVAPTEKSVRGAAVKRDRPPARVFERPVIVRSAPPAAHAGFAAQQPQLTATPGKPLDNAARKELKPAAAAPAPVIKVVTPIQAAPPSTRPPPVAPSAKSGEERGRSDARGRVAAPATSGVTGAPTQGAAPAQTQATPPVPAARVTDPRTDAEQRGQRERRGQPAALPPPPPPNAAPPQVVPAQAAPPAPSAQPQQQRGRAEQRGQGEQRGQPAALPAPIPQRAAPPQVAPAQAAPPAPSAQPQQQRGRAEQRGQGEQRGQPVAAPPPPPQRVVPPAVASVPQVVPPAPVATPQRSRPEPAAKQAEPSPPVAAPRPPPAQAAPKAEPRGKAPKPAADEPNDKKKDRDEQKREEEIRKRRG